MDGRVKMSHQLPEGTGFFVFFYTRSRNPFTLASSDFSLRRVLKIAGDMSLDASFMENSHTHIKNKIKKFSHVFLLSSAKQYRPQSELSVLRATL